MKLWKTLLPVATLGATAACVVPMATACSGKVYFSTTDANFKPDKQYKDGAETTIATTAEAEELNKAYFADPKIYVQDFTYVLSSTVKEDIEEAETAKTAGKIESYDIHYEVKVSDYSLQEKELEISTFGNVKGYVLNVTFNASLYNSQTSVKDTTTKTQITEIQDETMYGKLSNCFIMVNPYTVTADVNNVKSSISPGVICLGHKDLDWSMVVTYADKDTYQFKNYETGTMLMNNSDILTSESKIDKANYGDELYQSSMAGVDAGDSYFMEKVTFTIPTPTTK